MRGHPSTTVVCLAVALSLATPLPAQTRTPVVSLLEQRQRHVVMQEWDISCGAAALTTLLNYQHGLSLAERDVAVEMLGRQAYVDDPELLKIRQGFSLLDLKLFVERRGFAGRGLGRLSLADAIERAPILVPITVRGYNHFVVFRGKAGNRVLLADPAWGNRTLLVEQFLEAWIDFPTIGKVGFTVERKPPVREPPVAEVRRPAPTEPSPAVRKAEATRVETAAGDRSASARTGAPTARETPGADRFHVVEQGENLWDIAESTTGRGRHWTVLAAINDLPEGARLLPGQTLLIPAFIALTESAAPTAPDRSPDRPRDDTSLAAADRAAVGERSSELRPGRAEDARRLARQAEAAAPFAGVPDGAPEPRKMPDATKVDASAGGDVRENEPTVNRLLPGARDFVMLR